MSAKIQLLLSLLFSLVISFFLSFIFTKLIIYLSKKNQRGQVERSFGLESHIKKDGTPTMGGIAIVLSSIVTISSVLPS